MLLPHKVALCMFYNFSLLVGRGWLWAAPPGHEERIALPGDHRHNESITPLLRSLDQLLLQELAQWQICTRVRPAGPG